MNRMDLIGSLTRKARGGTYVAKGANVAATGEASAIKQRQRCEWRRDGNWRSNNFGASLKTPRQVAAELPKEAAKPAVALRPKRTAKPNYLNEIAAKWLHGPKPRATDSNHD